MAHNHINPVHDRPVYASPGCDVAGADDIGVFRKAAPGADEFGLRAPVRLIDRSTREARPARVARVNKHKNDASETRLVFDECSQLKERPTMQICPLSFPNRYPIANALEVFQSNPAAGVLSLANNRFTDDVICVGVEPLFPTTELFEVPLGALGSARLESGAQLSDATTDREGLLTRMHLSVGIDCDVSDPKVDTEPAFGVDGATIRDFDSHEQVEFSAPIHQIGLPASAFEARLVVGADGARNDYSAIESENRKPIEAVFETVEPLVVRDGTERLEAAKARAIALVDLADLGDEAHDVLGGKTEPLPEFAVVELLKLQLVSGLQLKSLLSKPRAGFVYPAHRGEQTGFLVSRREQFNSCHELHGLRCATPKPAAQLEAAVPPRPEGRGFPAIQDLRGIR